MDAALSAAPGRACVQSTGNYYSRPIHTQGVLRPGEVRDIGFQTGEEDGFAHEIDIWYAGRDRVTVEVIAPPRKPAGRAVAGQNVGRLYNRRRDPNNHDNQAHVYLDATAPRGAWVLRLHGTDVVDGRYHCWVERDPGCSTCQPSFDPADVVSSSTTGTICNGFLTIAVGAYDGHRADRPLATFSSSGPTRDGRLKPDVIAPGVQVLSARSAPRQPTADDPKLARMSGTSMAAPYVAGTVALMFEAAGRPLPVRQTRELLLKAAAPLPTGESQSRWGSGFVDVAQAVAAAAEAGFDRAHQTTRELVPVGGSARDTGVRTSRYAAEEIGNELALPAQVASQRQAAATKCACTALRPASTPDGMIPAEFDFGSLANIRFDALNPTVASRTCRLSETITFDTAKSFVFPRFRSVIDAAFDGIVERFISGPVRVRVDRLILVTGHTDTQEVWSASTSLSQRRAQAVVAILTFNPDEWERIAFDEHWWHGTEIEVMSAEVYRGATEVPSIHRYQRNTAIRRDLIRRYLKSLRPAWLPVERPPFRPNLMAVIGSPPGVIGCGQTPPRNHPGVAGEDRRAEIYFFPAAYSALHDCSEYRKWQSVCAGLIAPQIELRDEYSDPYAGPFDLTLPTGEILHEQTNSSGQAFRTLHHHRVRAHGRFAGHMRRLGDA